MMDQFAPLGQTVVQHFIPSQFGGVTFSVRVRATTLEIIDYQPGNSNLEDVDMLLQQHDQLLRNL